MSERQQHYVRFRDPYVYPAREGYAPLGAGADPAYGNGQGRPVAAAQTRAPVRNGVDQVVYPPPMRGGEAGGGVNPRDIPMPAKRRSARTPMVDRVTPIFAALSLMVLLYTHSTCRCAAGVSSSAAAASVSGAASRSRAEARPAEAPVEELMPAGGAVQPPPEEPQAADPAAAAVPDDGHIRREVRVELPPPGEVHITRSLLKGREIYPTWNVTARDILEAPYAKRIIVSRASNLIYCPIPAVASSNWKLLLRKFEGREDYTDLQKAHDRDESGFRFLNEFTVEQVNGILTDSSFVTFTFVRNPLHRILSSYIQKFTKKEPTSSEYQVFLGQLYGWEYVKAHNVSELRRPSFDEFLQAVIDQEDDISREHWASQSALCGIGEFPYDFVGKLETAQEDAARLLKAVGRSDTKFPTQAELQYPSSKAEELVSALYTPEMRGKLARKQANDFELLKYEP